MEFARILVATDFSDAAEGALDAALVIAMKCRATVLVLHAFAYSIPTYGPGPSVLSSETHCDPRPRLRGALLRARARYLRVDSLLTCGEPSASILQAAREHGADLILLGTQAHRRRSRRRLGSVARSVLRLAPLPVLTVSAHTEDAGLE